MDSRMDKIERERLNRFLDLIRPADKAAMEAAKKRWNSVAKPIGSLGVLETDIIKIAGIRENSRDLRIRKSALAVMCADHGVVEEGVTQTGQEVTRIVAENFTRGMTSVTVMCRTTGTDVFPVDIGIACEAFPDRQAAPFVLLDRKIAAGSRNIVKEAAMTGEQCVRALLCGIELAGELKAMGYEILATGEMGIGNTTPSSALAAVLTGKSFREVTGRGAGLSDDGLVRKQQAVKGAVERFYKADPGFVPEGREPVIKLLSELGGYDIAGMTGFFLGGAVYRLPVIMDGFISTVAALLAVKLCRAAGDFLLASHMSTEPAGISIMEELGLAAPLNCGMHLGEGSGAVALLPLLYMGADVYEQMSTFDDIEIDSYVDYQAEGEGKP